MTEFEVNEQLLRRTLKTVAERTAIAPGDEALFTRGPVALPHRSHRRLAGAVAIVILLAAVGVAIAYGPRSSDMSGPGQGDENAASKPAVRTSWVVPVPVGYSALQGNGELRLGVQSLNSASYRRPGLRREGWRSGVLEIWAPTALARSGHPYSTALTITLRIDQFGSPEEALRYQTKAYTSYKKATPGASFVRLSVPGAEALRSTQAGQVTTDQFFVWFRRGPYDVEIGGGQTHVSDQFERLIEGLAEAQYDRLPH